MFLFLFDVKARNDQNSAESNEKEVTKQFWGDIWYLLESAGHPLYQSSFKRNF